MTSPAHRSLLRLAGGFYLVLTLAGVVWVVVREGIAGLRPAADWEDLALATALGVAAGLAVVVVWHLAARSAPGLRQFEDSLAPAFAGLPRAGVAWLAFASAVGEEVFFRAGVQGTWGIWLASVAFGMLHFPLRRELAPWPLFAFVLGLLMGALYAGTGTLLAPVAMHFTVNFVHLGRLAARPSPEDVSGDPRPC